MNPVHSTARRAAAVYLLLGLTAPFSLLYIPRAFRMGGGDAAAAAGAIRASEMLFRAGIVAELASATIMIFLVMTLYRIFHRVDRMQAALLVILGAVVSAPVSFANVLNELAALMLVRGQGGYLAAFTPQQLEAMALFFLGLHGKGLMVVQIFWGLWLFPFGVLVMRSGFIPRLLGILLIVNGAAYLVVSLTAFLAPAYTSLVSRWALIPETGELWIMLWLLIKGAKVEPQPLPAAA